MEDIKMKKILYIFLLITTMCTVSSCNDNSTSPEAAPSENEDAGSNGDAGSGDRCV